MQSAGGSGTQRDCDDLHIKYMRQALELAKRFTSETYQLSSWRSPHRLQDHTTLATGYTLECEGNTNAEQSCLLKLSEKHGIPEKRLEELLPDSTVLYITVEPCFKRLSGNMPCVERILRLRKSIKTVCVGVVEPEKFVGQNTGRKMLEDAGIEVVLVRGMEEEILSVAIAGHTY
jgi:pyrimidine deaminase RibD-like protein